MTPYEANDYSMHGQQHGIIISRCELIYASDSARCSFDNVWINCASCVTREGRHDELFVLDLNGTTVEEVVSKWNEKGVNK